MRPGLVSITFRRLSPVEILDLCATAGLNCIEWGGDVHVPHGDLARAREVSRQTTDAGLDVTAYGSYFRLGSEQPENPDFKDVLDTAVALEAPVIRVWAGTRASQDADEAYRERVAREALKAADLAAQAGIRLAYEFHSDSLTDSTASTAALLTATRHPAIHCLWQPAIGSSPASDAESIATVAPRLEHVHVFHWVPDWAHRFPLAGGSDRWCHRLTLLRHTGKNPDLLIEFVPDDDPTILAREAATLRGWLANQGPH